MIGALRKLFFLTPAVGIAAVFFAATPALAAISPVSISNAQFVAKGVEVDLTVTFTCTAGDTVGIDPFSFYGPGVTATVQQAVTKTQQASGFAQLGFGGTCTGSPQSIVMQVVAGSGGPPFRVGPAVASVNVLDCDPTGTCVSSSSGLVTVRISK